MITKFKRKLTRAFKRQLRNKRFVGGIFVTLACIGVVGYAVYMDTQRLTVDPASYRPLLNLIAKVESKDNYNAYFGNPTNSSTDFTKMTIQEVQHWQADFVAQGNASSAVGRYQIINTTLAELIAQLRIDPRQKFDAATQDKLAIALLERRGSEAYINNELTPEEFAANLAKEWAALPKATGANPDDSYYDGDGLNQALVGTHEIVRTIELIRAK